MRGRLASPKKCIDTVPQVQTRKTNACDSTTRNVCSRYGMRLLLLLITRLQPRFLYISVTEFHLAPIDGRQPQSTMPKQECTYLCLPILPCLRVYGLLVLVPIFLPRRFIEVKFSDVGVDGDSSKLSLSRFSFSVFEESRAVSPVLHWPQNTKKKSRQQKTRSTIEVAHFRILFF